MKAMKIISGVYLLLFILGFAWVQLSGIKTVELTGLNVIHTLLWYRLAFYLLVLLFWPTLSVWLSNRRAFYQQQTQPPIFDSREAEETYLASINKQALDGRALLKKAWWKVAVFMLIFEVMAVQKLWL